MKKTFRCLTLSSRPTPRQFLAMGTALTALAVPAFLLTGCGSGGGGDPSPSPSVGSNQTLITGRLLDVNTGSTGVSGATVQFAGVSARTDPNGNFSLTVPRNTAAGTATITTVAGTALYSYASTSAGCANSLTISVGGPLSSSTYSLGNIFVYSKTSTSAPNPPCI